MAREPYLVPEGSAIDLRYAMALGLIMGICVEAVRCPSKTDRPTLSSKQARPDCEAEDALALFMDQSVMIGI